MRNFFDSIGFKRVVICLLILATYILFTSAPRYQINSINLLHNSDFSEGFNNWMESSNCGRLTQSLSAALLDNQKSPCTVFLRQQIPIPLNATQLKLAAEVNTHNVSQGKLSWQSARLSLVGIDRSGTKLWHHPHMIKLPPQSKGWQHVSQVFSIPPDAVALIVGLEIMDATGTVSARKLKLSSVSENSWFSTAANSLLILWGVTFLWLGKNLHRLFSSKIIQGSFLIVSASIAIGCCMIPGKIRDIILDRSQETIGKLKIVLVESPLWSYVPPELQIDLSLSPDKAGHFVLFAMLAFLVRVGRPQDRFAAQCFNLMLFAASTEVLQFYISGRQPGITDWFIDAGGLTLGFFFAAIFRHRQNNH